MPNVEITFLTRLEYDELVQNGKIDNNKFYYILEDHKLNGLDLSLDESIDDTYEYLE